MKKNELKATHKDQKHATILGIRIDSTSKDRLLSWINSKITSRDKFYIVTPNPEIVLQAQKDKKLAKILNSSDLAIPDGVGIAWAAKLLGQKPPFSVLKGREVFFDLIKLAAEKNWRVFLFGGEGDEAYKSKVRIKKIFNNLEIKVDAGPKLDKNAEPVSEVDTKIEIDAIAKINNFSPHILFVALGAPKQEKWIYKWLPKLDIGGAMVVGQAFNYFSGKSKPVPLWIEKNSLEWLWRLITEPWRIKRVFNATVVFPLLVIKHKLSR